MLSLNQIFYKRKQYIPEINAILNNPTTVNITVEGVALAVDYRRIVISSLRKYPIPIVLSCGWGSGWEGTVPLAFSLACEGFEVFIISLPGYGSSDNFPAEMVDSDILEKMASAIIEIMKNLTIPAAYLVGHSMAAIYAMKVAKMKPHMVEQLVLLNASGIKRYGNIFSKLNMAKKFVLSGIKLHLRYKWMRLLSKEDDYILDLVSWCRKQKSPFGKGRSKQRVTEFWDICRDHLIQDAKIIEVPVVYIAGASDTVFDPFEGRESLFQALPSDMEKESSILAKVPHNPTLYHAEITAAMIGHFLEPQEGVSA